jgi:hypothetical protein
MLRHACAIACPHGANWQIGTAVRHHVYAAQKQDGHKIAGEARAESAPISKSKNKFKRDRHHNGEQAKQATGTSASQEPPVPGTPGAKAVPCPALPVGVPKGQKTKAKRKAVLDEKKKLKKLKRQARALRPQRVHVQTCFRLASKLAHGTPEHTEPR